jgi:hypothetical protein
MSQGKRNHLIAGGVLTMAFGCDELERCRKAVWMHGRRSVAAIATRRRRAQARLRLHADLRRLENLLAILARFEGGESHLFRLCCAMATCRAAIVAMVERRGQYQLCAFGPTVNPALSKPQPGRGLLPRLPN